MNKPVRNHAQNTIGKAIIWMSVIAAIALIITIYYVPYQIQIAKENGAPLTAFQSALFSVTIVLQQVATPLLGLLVLSTCAGTILLLLTRRPHNDIPAPNAH